MNFLEILNIVAIIIVISTLVVIGALVFFISRKRQKGLNIINEKDAKEKIKDIVIVGGKTEGTYSVSKKESPKEDKKQFQFETEKLRLEKAQLLERIANNETMADFKQILLTYAGNEILGDQKALPLPRLEKPTLTATQMADMFIWK